MKSEQKICLECGFCCDGTLFHHASLKKGEKGNLPHRIEQHVFTDKGNECFRLPCVYFCGKCSIYKEKRPYICSSFRCRLLKDYSESKLTFREAITIIRRAVELRKIIFTEYSHLSGKNGVIYFKSLTNLLVGTNESGTFNEEQKKINEILLGKCNLLEALLIKHMRSEGEFRDLMDNSNYHGINIG